MLIGGHVHIGEDDADDDDENETSIQLLFMNQFFCSIWFLRILALHFLIRSD